MDNEIDTTYNTTEVSAETAATKDKGRPLCRKCLLREMMENGALEEHMRLMMKRVEMMDADLRCTAEEYEDRLAACKTCENLLAGMCKLCGCYVEFRAAAKANSCPATKKRWLAIEF